MTTVAYEQEMAFIRAQCAIWGEDEIYDLIERGYEVVYVPDVGYRFVLPTQSKFTASHSSVGD